MRDLSGSTWAYKAGASGTVTVPAGARILQIVAHSTGAASVAIFGGDAIPIITGAGPTRIVFDHELVVSKTGATDVVFTGTDSYFIEYVK